MWDLLILTAGDENQGDLFRHQLVGLDWKEYCKEVRVEIDPPGIKTGTGGTTIYLLRKLAAELGSSWGRCLVIHSGGSSQRTPHLSLRGKIFSVLPNGRTSLLQKLHEYRSEVMTFAWPAQQTEAEIMTLFIRALSNALPQGVFISASDVMEKIRLPAEWTGSGLEEDSLKADVVLMGHEASLEEARQHGVYVLKDTQQRTRLEKVLQKPTMTEMIESGAILDKEKGLAVIDSAFWLSAKVCVALTSCPDVIAEELCVYGDFLRPLGNRPDEGYIEQTASPQLKILRRYLYNTMRRFHAIVVNNGRNSFFHFGSLQEVVHHISVDSVFRKTFSIYGANVVFTRGSPIQAKTTSFVEYCNFPNGATIGANSIVSFCESMNNVVIPSDLLMYTTPFIDNSNEARYITVAIGLDDDVKCTSDDVHWLGKATRTAGTLWRSKFFCSRESASESFEATLLECERRMAGETFPQDAGERFSMSELPVLAHRNIEMFLKELKLKGTHEYDPTGYVATE